MLALLAGVNLVVDFGLWTAYGVDGVLGLLALVAIGTTISQILFLALWFTCMNGSWVWRFVVPPSLTALIGCAAAVGIRTMSTAPIGMLVFPLVFQLPLFGLVALLWPFCRTRGWRIAVGVSAGETHRNQFRIGDVLAWMTIIGVFLTLVRLIVTSEEGGGRGSWL